MKKLLFILCLIATVGYSQDRSENKIEQINKHCIVTHTLAQQSTTTTAVYYRLAMRVQEDTVHHSYGFIVAKLDDAIFGVWLCALDKTKAMFFSCNIGSNGSVYLDGTQYIAESNAGRTMYFYQKSDSLFVPIKMVKQTRDKNIEENYIFK